jgi:hypothetical protein
VKQGRVLREENGTKWEIKASDGRVQILVVVWGYCRSIARSPLRAEDKIRTLMSLSEKTSNQRRRGAERN